MPVPYCDCEVTESDCDCDGLAARLEPKGGYG